MLVSEEAFVGARVHGAVAVHADAAEQRLVAALPVRSRQGGLRIDRDGEVSDGPGHLTLRAAADKLAVYLS